MGKLKRGLDSSKRSAASGGVSVQEGRGPKTPDFNQIHSIFYTCELLCKYKF